MASPRRASAEYPRGTRGVHASAEYPRGSRGVAATRPHGLSHDLTERSVLAQVKKAAAEVKRDLKRKEAGGGKDTGKAAKWKAQSNQLRDAMKNVRDCAKAEKKGLPMPAATPSGPDPSLRPCPHCGRSFNEKAAERHIPKCQSIKAKPKTLTRGGGVPSKSGGVQRRR